MVLICSSCNRKPDYFVGDYKSLLSCKITTDTIHRAYVINLKQGPMILLYPDLKAQFKNLNVYELFQVRLKLSFDTFTKQLKGDLFFDLDPFIDIVYYNSTRLFQTYVGLFPATNMKVDSFRIRNNKLNFKFHFDNHGGKWKNYSASIIKEKGKTVMTFDTSFLGYNTELNPLFKGKFENSYHFDTFIDNSEIKKLKKLLYKRQKDILDSIFKTKDSLMVFDSRKYLRLLGYYYK